MLKDKQKFEMNRDRYVEAGRKLAEEKKHKQKLIRATQPAKGNYTNPSKTTSEQR